MQLHPNSYSRHDLRSRLIFVSLLAGFVLFFQLPSLRSHAADAPAPAKKLVPGLTLTFESSSGAMDARNARLVALLVPAHTPASPFLPVGPFKATWSGVFTTHIKDSYHFAAEGRGDLSVTLNEKPVLDLHGDFANHLSKTIVVHKGKNRLVVTYKSPAEGDASIRLLDAAEGRPMEPMSPTIFTHDASDDVLMQHSKLRMGREILATMRCMNCHTGTSGPAAQSMPEMKQDAPNLTDLQTRLNANWIAYWITNPKALRPTATMPRVFHEQPASAQPAVDQRAVDIAAYLTSKPQAVSVAMPAVDANVLAHGARLFTGLGCVACHLAPGVEDSDPTLNRVPLKFVKEKFAPGELAVFLKKPEAHYAWIHMPNFHLTDDEATALSAWLESRCAGNALPKITLTANVAHGKKLFETSGCLSCHAVEGSTPQPAASVDLAHANWTKGCASDGGKGVDFGFNAEQQESLRALGATDWKPALDRDPLPEFAGRQMTALRCNASLSLDSDDSVWDNLDTEIGAIEQNLPPRPANDPPPHGDQSRPPLTWTGEKLRPSWMASFIAGRIPYKPRSWVFARMPSFASRAELLASGMALAHGCPVTDEVRPPVDPHLADIGRGLTAQTMFGCVKCHSCGDQPAIAPFEAFAPNFAHISDRLRHEYFTHWMRNPQHYLPGTKMPSFADADGNTAYKDIRGGAAAAQYEAIWQYLRAGEKIVPAQ
jgi:cytochrome c551/c552